MANNLLRRLNVRVVGDGERHLVLAHGMGTDQSSWHRVLPYFTPFYKVVLYDLPCAGTVDPETFDFRRYNTLDPYVDDLLDILDALEVTRCTYVGHSVSAMIGLLAAIRRHELFVKLILIGASPRFMNDEDYFGGFEREEVEIVFAAMHSNYAAWVQGFAPLAVGVDLPEVIQEFSRTLFNMRPDISLFVCRTIFNTDFRGVLGLVRVPCFIIQSLFDHAVPVFVADYMNEHLGGPSSIIYVETNGHIPQLSAPAMLAHALRAALRANPPSR